MASDFWLRLKNNKKPILALAPMAGFSDSAFRQICCYYGAKVVYSEMVSAAALFYNQKKKDNATLDLLKFNRLKERYFVVQIFGSEPKHFAFAAKLISEKIKPDGIDINFGCPVPKIIKQGAGAGLMKDLEKSREVIEAVLANTKLPVSIKIRTQSGSVSAFDFLKNIRDLKISALMIHGRSLSQGFAGEADFEKIKEVRQFFSGIILANGGINSLSSAKKALKLSRVDGLGLARGVLGRPWLFKEINCNKEMSLSSYKIFKIALKQAVLEKEQKGQHGIIEFRKHLAWYAQGLPQAAKIRSQLVKIKNISDLKKLLANSELFQPAIIFKDKK